MSIQALYKSSISMAFIATNLLFSAPLFSAPKPPSITPEAEVQRFADTLTLIKSYYVNPVKNHLLFNQAISGILMGLDPQSVLIEKSMLIQAQFLGNSLKDKDNEANLGLELSMKDGILIVVTPKLDSPAFKAGILPGDYLIKLGKQSTQGLSLEEASDLMKGKEGALTEVVILRKSVHKPLVFKLAFAKPSTASIQSRLLDQGLGYVRISEFQQKTASDMQEAIKTLEKQTGGMLKGLVLDLRFNPGGMLESAVHVADAFLDNRDKNPKMFIVKTEGRIPNLQYQAVATPGDILAKAPMVVLINRGSAFGAEIVAGALKDNRRAVTLGLPSAGKGSVQTLIPLDENTVLKLTTALYVTPKGSLIQDNGIIPDMLVEELVIPKNRVKEERMPYNEADLKDHLESDMRNAKAESPTFNEKLDNLMYEDYQLYTAMSILKGTLLTR